ncbi:hypothetical protein HXA35_01825 [Bacillus sp. A301a_S52]|nr:hypothetical protein [Bacillus sp. A301a_S52]
MTLNWKRVSLIIVAVGIVTVLVMFNNNKNAQQEANERILLEHYIAARVFKLGTFYDSIEDPIDVTLYPTDETQPIMDRWKIISELIPEIPYPEEDIRKNNWLELDKELISSARGYEKKIRLEEDESSYVHPKAIDYFIFNNRVREGSPLEKLLEEKGIDYEKE